MYLQKLIKTELYITNKRNLLCTNKYAKQINKVRNNELCFLRNK